MCSGAGFTWESPLSLYLAVLGWKVAIILVPHPDPTCLTGSKARGITIDRPVIGPSDAAAATQVVGASAYVDAKRSKTSCEARKLFNRRIRCDQYDGQANRAGR
jgi:hypothetical protein